MFIYTTVMISWFLNPLGKTSNLAFIIAVSIKCSFTHIQEHSVNNTSRQVQIDKCVGWWYFCMYNVPFSVCYNNTDKQNEKNCQNDGEQKDEPV